MDQLAGQRLHSKTSYVSTYLLTHEVLEYPLEYASILHSQKLHQVHLTSSAITAITCFSTTRLGLYVFFLQIKWVARLILSPFCSLTWYKYLYKPTSANTSCSDYVSHLSSPTIFSLVASFCFMFMTLSCSFFLQYFFTYFAPDCYNFSGHFSSLTRMGLNNRFVNLLLKASTKAVFFKQLCNIFTL